MKLIITGLLALAAVIMVGSNLTATNDVTATADGKRLKQTVELGQVNWNRDLDAAKKTSAQTKRPLFLLFQEVPG